MKRTKANATATEEPAEAWTKQDIEDIFSTKKLCDGCERHYGYCINAKVELRKLPKEYFNMDKLAIENLVPFKSYPNNRNHSGSFTLANLQLGHDAFHQKDYETALLHYLAVLEINYKHAEAYLYGAVCHYMQGNLDGSLDYANRCIDSAYLPSVDVKGFVLHCENKILGLQNQLNDKKSTTDVSAIFCPVNL
jgi:tetratricopeptide (TPR) repeat protein